MRTTIRLDDELVAKAQDFTGLKKKSSLIREALEALIERERARRSRVWVAANPVSRHRGCGDRRDPALKLATTLPQRRGA